MLLTLYYMYATLLQWWRISSTRNKISKAMTNQTSVILYKKDQQPTDQHKANLKDLLFFTDYKIGCTVIPKKKVCLNSWMPFSASTLFPFLSNSLKLNSPHFPVLIHADLSSFNGGDEFDQLQITDLGIPVAWTAENNFSVVLKTDLDKFAKLVSCFLANSLTIYDGMEILQIESIDLDGEPKTVENENVFKKIKWPLPVSSHRQWHKFVEDLKNVCAKTTHLSNSKNGSVHTETRTDIIEETKCQLNENSNAIPIVISEDNVYINTSNLVSKKTENHSEHSTKHKTKTDKSEVKAENKVHKKNDKPNCSMEKTKEKRASSKEKDKISHSSSMDKIKSDKHKKDKFVKKHSRENIIDEKVLPENDTKKKSEKQTKEHGEKVSRRRRFIQAKPPNVLVYADSLETRGNVKNVLQDVLNKNRYTVYELSPNETSNFTDNCTLVVVCGNVAPALASHLLHYLLSGGKLFCLCSDFLNNVLNTFTTAEVREHELVRFSYGEWRRVRMMHHIFCYQASPAKKHFSQDSDPSSSNHSSGNSPIAPRTPSTVELHHNNKTYVVQVRVLGQEETWQTPSILLASVKAGTGKAAFSQVHLEVDPTQYVDDEDKFAALKESNIARLEILKDILSTHLDIDCSAIQKDFEDFTPAFFLGKHDLKLKLLSELSGLTDNVMKLPKITLQFCGKGVEPPMATSSHLPVLVHACPDKFSTIDYFENLQTEDLGRLVVYSDVMTSSMEVLCGAKYKHGLVVLPRQQTAGIGRGGNTWLSPIGCAMFSMQVHVCMNSVLATSLPLIQHMVAVAVVSAVRKQPGYEDIDLGLKWPNDIYADASVKIGGIILNSSIDSSLAICNIGCGVNLSNSLPTTCINSMITKHNESKGTSLKTFSYEKFLAVIFTELELLLNTVQNGNMDYFFDSYYKYWLHSDAEISVQTAKGVTREVTITGIDQYGYLTVLSKDGTGSSVQPDGNTFDMMQGLIAPKIN